MTVPFTPETTSGSPSPRPVLRVAATLGVALFAFASPSRFSAQRPASSLAVHGVTIVDVLRGTLEPGRSILVSDGRITAIADRRTIERLRPRSAVDATGKFVIPGLWDMHVEQGLPLSPSTPLDSNPGFFFPMFLAHGVTGVRDVAGAPELLARWRSDIVRGAVAGPRIVFTGPKVGRERPDSPTFPIESTRDLHLVIDSLRRAGASDAYVLTLPADYYPALEAASRRTGLAFGGLIPLTVSLEQAVAHGQRSIDHFDGILIAASGNERRVRRMFAWSESRPWWARLLWKTRIWTPIANRAIYAIDRRSAEAEERMLAMLARDSVYQVPTLRLLSGLNRAGDSAILMPPEPFGIRVPRNPSGGFASAPVPASHPMARVTAEQRRIIRAMSRAGVPIMAGSDPPNLYAAPGMSLHDELELLVSSGLQPIEALRAATLAPARFLGATDSLGSVAVGKVADLVLLDADPTVSIGNTRRIFAVVARGRYYDRAALDDMVAMARRVAEPIAAYWKAQAQARPGSP
jgi:hypothetical protein